MALDLFWTFLSWVVIFPTVFMSGSVLCSRVRVDETVLQGVLNCAVGLACLSFGIVLLSTFHLLNTSSIWWFLIGLGLLSLGAFKEWLRWLKALGSQFVLTDAKGPLKLLKVLFLVSFLALLLGTLSPEIGNDALCYQLNLPKVFLRQGSLEPIYYDYNSYFPLFMNNLYLVGLATGGALAAKLFHFFCGFLLLVSVRNVIFQETENETLAFFIALAIWLTPTVYNLLASAYVDVAIAFYTFLAVFIFLWAQRTMNQKTFVLSGFLTGCAISIKYLSLMTILGFFVLGALEIVRGRGVRDSVKNFVFWMIATMATSMWWPLRNWVATGNPFFPYFGSFFRIAEQPSYHFHTYGFGRNLFAFISLFWNMLFYPERFGTFPTRIGGFYFLFFPFLLLALIFVPRARGFVAFTFSFLVCWFFVAQADRWLLPILPVMGVASSLGMQWSYVYASSQMKGVLKQLGGTAGLIALAVCVAMGTNHYRYSYPLFLGLWTKEKYLRKMERTLPVATWINQSLPPKAKILVESEPRIFYFDRDTVRSVYLKWRHHYEERGWNVAVLRNLLKSLKITHLLTSDLVSPTPVESKSLAGALAKSGYASEVKRIPSENIRDEKYVYTLYELRAD